MVGAAFVLIFAVFVLFMQEAMHASLLRQTTRAFSYGRFVVRHCINSLFFVMGLLRSACGLGKPSLLHGKMRHQTIMVIQNL